MPTEPTFPAPQPLPSPTSPRSKNRNSTRTRLGQRRTTRKKIDQCTILSNRARRAARIEAYERRPTRLRDITGLGVTCGTMEGVKSHSYTVRWNPS